MTNIEIALALYAAVGRRDLAAAGALLDPEVVLHDPGAHGHGGDHRGRAAVLDLLGSTTGVVRTEVLDVLGGREHAAVYCRVRGDAGSGGAASLDNHTVHLLRIRDGRIVEAWFHNRDQPHVDAFWAAA